MKFFSRLRSWKLNGGSQSSMPPGMPRDATNPPCEVEFMNRNGEAEIARLQSNHWATPGNISVPEYREHSEGVISQNEYDMIKQQRELKTVRRQSTGRGGLGNMANSTYRFDEIESLNTQNEMLQRQDELKQARRRSLGRGGLGNIILTDSVCQAEAERLIAENENEMIQRHRELKAGRRQSTIGRGGLGNIDQSQTIPDYATHPIQRRADKPYSAGRRGLESAFRFISQGLRRSSRQASTS